MHVTLPDKHNVLHRIRAVRMMPIKSRYCRDFRAMTQKDLHHSGLSDQLLFPARDDSHPTSKNCGQREMRVADYFVTTHKQIHCLRLCSKSPGSVRHQYSDSAPGAPG